MTREEALQIVKEWEESWNQYLDDNPDLKSLWEKYQSSDEEGKELIYQQIGSQWYSMPEGPEKDAFGFKYSCILR